MLSHKHLLATPDQALYATPSGALCKKLSDHLNIAEANLYSKRCKLEQHPTTALRRQHL